MSFSKRSQIAASLKTILSYMWYSSILCLIASKQGFPFDDPGNGPPELCIDVYLPVLAHCYCYVHCMSSSLAASIGNANKGFSNKTSRDDVALFCMQRQNSGY